MEQAIYVGCREYSYKDPQTGKLYEGYTLYMLQAQNPQFAKGYIPVTLYDRFNNRQKYPSVSKEFYESHGIDKIKINSKVQILFDRNNKLIEFVAAN